MQVVLLRSKEKVVGVERDLWIDQQVGYSQLLTETIRDNSSVSLPGGFHPGILVEFRQ